MKGNCKVCMIPTNGELYGGKLCRSCVAYLNRMSPEEFANIAVNCFGKSREEADKWLSELPIEDMKG